MAALEPAHERPEERNLDDQDEADRAEDRRRERLQQPARIGRDRAEALVDLEQHRGARRGPDAGIRLDQPPLLAVERVLGTVQVADLHLRAAVPQQPMLVLAQRVTAADLRGIVGVEHPAGGGPDLHADDRVAENSTDHRVVNRPHGVRATGEEPVAPPSPRRGSPPLAHASASAASPRRSQPSAGRSSRLRRPPRTLPMSPPRSERSTDRVVGAADTIAVLGEAIRLMIAASGRSGAALGPMSHCGSDRREGDAGVDPEDRKGDPHVPLAHRAHSSPSSPSRSSQFRPPSRRAASTVPSASRAPARSSRQAR